jgi:hypothetical protein
MQDDLTRLVLIFDRSSSMLRHMHSACDAVNELMEGQRKEPGRLRLDLVLFNEEMENVYTNRDAGSFEPLVPGQNYQPAGTTALVHAVGATIDRVGRELAVLPEDDRPGKVMFVIQTDGEENTPRAYTRAQVLDMIRRQERDYQWAFLFLGADQDAWANALGVAAADTVSYDSANPNVAFAAVDDAVTSYRTGRRSAGNLTGTKRGVDTRTGRSGSS